MSHHHDRLDTHPHEVDLLIEPEHVESVVQVRGEKVGVLRCDHLAYTSVGDFFWRSETVEGEKVNIRRTSEVH